MTRDLLTADEVAAALRDLPAWTGDPKALRRTVTCPSFGDAVRLVDEVANVAEELDHHPDIDLRYRDVTFVTSTHSAGGVTAYDVELAKRIDGLAG